MWTIKRQSFWWELEEVSTFTLKQILNFSTHLIQIQLIQTISISNVKKSFSFISFLPWKKKRKRRIRDEKVVVDDVLKFFVQKSFHMRRRIFTKNSLKILNFPLTSLLDEIRNKQQNFLWRNSFIEFFFAKH